MRLLGIDYGRAKVGLAIAESSLASPLYVIRVSGFEDAVKKIVTVIETEKPETVVVGVSEGTMGEEQERFASALSRSLSQPVVTWDEGLTTYDAEARAIASGAGPKKRRALEDAYAATLMLQSYIDNKLE